MRRLFFVLLLAAVFVFPLPGGFTANETESGILSINGPLPEPRILRLSIQSAHLRIKAPFMVYLPKGYGGGDMYPVWYGLHSHSTTETMWLNIGGVGEAAGELAERGELKPMIMVFPLTRYDTAREIKEDMKDGKRDASRMEQFLCGELFPYIDSHFDTAKTPEGRFIGGFSMGGYFALQIAFHHPELFGKVGGYSPALEYSDFSGGRFEKWLDPSSTADKESDGPGFAKENGLDRIQVYLDCGNVNDPFSAGVKSLHDTLKERGISVEFSVYDGGHSLQLDKIGEYLKFYGGDY